MYLFGKIKNIAYLYRMRQRTTFNEAASNIVQQAFRDKYKYDPKTGVITRKKNDTDRVYTRLSKKGYVEAVYLTVEGVEYRCTYHRLCWFLHYNEVVPDNMQIDHQNNVKVHNWIDNLKLCINGDNKKKSEIYSNNVSGYKGVSYSKDVNQQGTEYQYYVAAISVRPKMLKIGRFKDGKTASAFYDAAAKYYYKEWALCNHQEEYIPTCSVEELRKLKRDKQFMNQLKQKLYGTTEMDIN